MLSSGSIWRAAVFRPARQERLIVAGFLDEVLQSLPVAAMRESLRSAIDAKLSLQGQPEGVVA